MSCTASPEAPPLQPGVKNVTPSLFHLTPLNEQSHSLNPFLLIDFYLCSASVQCRDEGGGLGAEVKSLMGKLTIGWVRFPSKHCCVVWFMSN